MKVRVYITKSRSMHYTVTVRDAVSGVLRRIEDKIGSLEEARRLAAKYKEVA